MGLIQVGPAPWNERVPWAPKGRRASHPHYGVVTAETIMHVAPIVPAASEPLDSVDPLFVLASDMWEKF